VAPSPAQQTWTPIATPAWTPNVAPDLAVVSETAAPVAPVAPPSAPARKPSTTRRQDDRAPSDRPAWMLPVIIGVVILLLLGGGGIYLLTRPGSRTPVATHTPSPSGKPTAKASPTPTNPGGTQTIPTYAPASVPPVVSVVFLPDTACKLNSTCRVDVEIKYSSPQSGTLGYVLKFFDRCTGTTTPLPGRSFKPPSGFIRADPGFQTVTLPTGSKSAALVAVSTTPAAAASAPLLLGSDTC